MVHPVPYIPTYLAKVVIHFQDENFENLILLNDEQLVQINIQKAVQNENEIRKCSKNNLHEETILPKW